MKTTVLDQKDLKKSKKQIVEKINSSNENQPNAEKIEEMPIFEGGKEPEEIKESTLLKAFNELKAENEVLKAKKVLNFQEAAFLFREKTKLLDEIEKLSLTKERIVNVNLKENTKENTLDSYYYKLGLFYGSRDEAIFKISNIMVIDEFLDFICLKLNTKIDELMLKVQEL